VTAADPRSDVTPVDAPLAERPGSSVTVYPDGPLVVRGDFELRDADGAEIATGHAVALCRCGRSALKPLCDGSHRNRRLGRRPKGGAD
jgi:hypothetical protein